MFNFTACLHAFLWGGVFGFDCLPAFVFLGTQHGFIEDKSRGRDRNNLSNNCDRILCWAISIQVCALTFNGLLFMLLLTGLGRPNAFCILGHLQIRQIMESLHKQALPRESFAGWDVCDILNLCYTSQYIHMKL